MKVLHFIPSLSLTAGSNIFGYKTGLMEAMSKYADIHLLTADVIRQSIKGVTIHKYSPLKNVLGSRFSSFDKFILSISPDIVHIHSCWNIQAYYFLKCCLKHRLQVVVTIDKQLEPWHVANHYFFSKLPKTLFYQYRIIANASLIHAVSDIEKGTIENWIISFPFFKKNVERKIKVIEVLKKPYGCVYETTAKEILSLYRSIIDNRPFLSMSRDDCRVEDLFIKSALSEMFTINELRSEDKKHLLSLTEESCRMILLHSYIQGVSDLLIKGAKKCNYTFPEFNIIDYSCVSTCSSSNDISDDDNFNYIISDNSLSDIEKNICCCILNLQNKLKYSLTAITRYDFIVLYKLLRYSNYNEALLRDKMVKYGLDKFTARLFFILKDRYGLSEGFMFFEPLCDTKTNRLMTKLYKTDIQ